MINKDIVILILLIAFVYCICFNREFFTNIIVRPLDFTNYNQTKCKAPLYNDKPGLKFCNDNIPKYYDVRYINSYSDYYSMLKDLLFKIGTNEEIVNNKLIEIDTCNIADYQVRNTINNKIAEVIKTTPSLQLNGSFKLENIRVTDIELKFYKDETETEYIKAVFSLYDLTRSATTEAYALLYLKPPLTILTAGLVYPNLQSIPDDPSRYPITTPLSFDIYDSLSSTNLSTYVPVSPNTKVDGGISEEMNELINKYYNYN